ncbi:trifunctional nucleotide phosphoesterase protein YfkN [Paraliobacillus ryukyuensis]|uniref:5'-nucleotidase/2',3'-cyclic-nucleotide 2'-phosphodiesterase/3'-nucleotidase n=1 Tax=Paraliobacillus ryukyuensis TaxID=200904 RepID=A0A366EDF8_9BACI|nr:bifunctional UDP-sugar hydrolase/5'-nucleotidase [Paraliobacillus ryukyuensis]RBP00441.1 5'-nucleotidase/2',3'-cyclic-nucleotide 2'-phosphodiesterase/3'-nucleotidase [Paraliobacillus ryukyuensis]
MESKQLTILATSDVHGYIYPTNYSDHQDRKLGLAKLATLIKEKRKKTPVVLLDNGDMIQGSPFTFYHAKFAREQKNPMIKVANKLGYQAAVFGNHEFNYGLDYLKQVIAESNFPWLSASILSSETNQPAFGQPYIISEIDGVRIAVIGVTTHYIPNWEEPSHIKGLNFADTLETTKYWVKKVRKEEQPDVCVVAYHGGFERDLHSGEPTEPLTGENQGYEISQEVEGMDVFITGHQHRDIATHLNGAAVVQPSNMGQRLGEITLNLEKNETGKWEVKSAIPKTIEIPETMKADAEILELVEELERDTQSWLDTPIGEIKGDMTIIDPLQVRLEDHPFIEFINRVQMEVSGAPISNTALFNNTSPGFPKQVTMRDIVSNYVFPNTLKVLELTGADIKAALEQSASYFIIDDSGEITVNPAYMEPKPQHYNYDMWEGITYELTISNPVGERVSELLFEGKPMDLAATFHVVMNNYRASGGGNFAMFQEKEIVKDIPTDMTELIADYILKHKTIEATCDNNWRVKK